MEKEAAGVQSLSAARDTPVVSGHSAQDAAPLRVKTDTGWPLSSQRPLVKWLLGQRIYLAAPLTRQYSEALKKSQTAKATYSPELDLQSVLFVYQSSAQCHFLNSHQTILPTL
ncbi:hypothetical protein NDU88_004719 [Pleurodeles waltl]|uniref:Uncharacterized protein n=1 Tax=Pleurodeles waltl TaxID=8319 RepID=A0AAV7VH09_PLEWA|nr:hypothetical protein NDU88_004719 [Pleurodeles waltl]